jgi:hypothetical protein
LDGKSFNPDRPQGLCPACNTNQNSKKRVPSAEKPQNKDSVLPRSHRIFVAGFSRSIGFHEKSPEIRQELDPFALIQGETTCLRISNHRRNLHARPARISLIVTLLPGSDVPPGASAWVTGPKLV